MRNDTVKDRRTRVAVPPASSLSAIGQAFNAAVQAGLIKGAAVGWVAREAERIDEQESMMDATPAQRKKRTFISWRER